MAVPLACPSPRNVGKSMKEDTHGSGTPRRSDHRCNRSRPSRSRARDMTLWSFLNSSQISLRSGGTRVCRRSPEGGLKSPLRTF